LTRTETILIVDDNRDNVELLCKRFDSMGFTTLQAYDGEEALEVVARQEPDMIVLDVMMPRMDGFEVCKRLKSNPATKLIPIILLTAKRDVPDKIKGLDTGADDYVTKPFNPRELIARVNGLLQRRFSEKKIASAEKFGALGQMAEGVAHEVRNPMVTIGGFARRIKNKLPEDDPLREYASHIIKEVDRLELMVNEIVSFKTLVIAPYQRVDLKELVSEILNKWGKKFTDKEIKVQNCCDGDNLVIEGDQENLRLALNNIIQNSVDAMPKGGELRIDCTADVTKESQVIMRLSDTGMGISKDSLPNVFDPFFTSKMKGAGMGLTVVHRIITRHGGEVGISSDSKGTKLTLVLPVKQDHSI
jgi:two-component system sensor histidine kinase/response regulator